ncbi:hypothetical protein MOQ72_42880 [Saccharopolyspora sp. K220]|uniref:hypothetical protein n=1 Tax=Saccharopolyspora soli TaxID=2926618 RepID=UPI001F5ACF2B|nr:hypothetical protein [Saccharopolyspora soli]MCI2424160.1 hypothetical protein [Saccharopolyspora soli]
MPGEVSDPRCSPRPRKRPEADRELVELFAYARNHDVCGVIQLGKGRPTLQHFGDSRE